MQKNVTTKSLSIAKKTGFFFVLVTALNLSCMEPATTNGSSQSDNAIFTDLDLSAISDLDTNALLSEDTQAPAPTSHAAAEKTIDQILAELDNISPHIPINTTALLHDPINEYADNATAKAVQDNSLAPSILDFPVPIAEPSYAAANGAGAPAGTTTPIEQILVDIILSLPPLPTPPFSANSGASAPSVETQAVVKHVTERDSKKRKIQTNPESTSEMSTPQETFKCSQCTQQLTSHIDLTYHEEHHKRFTACCENSDIRRNDQKQCKKCKLLFTYHDQLETHMKVHEENNPLPSSVSATSISQAAGAGAGATALSPSPAKKAKTDVPSPPLIPATQSTQSQALLAAAGIPITQTQTLQKSLKCPYPYCIEMVTSDLPYHKKLHGRFTACCENSDIRRNDQKQCKKCKLLFTYLHQFKIHMELHPESRESQQTFNCSQCAQQFTRYTDFTYHEENHKRFIVYCEKSNIKVTDPKQCKGCKLLFTDHDQFKTHMKLHKQNNPLPSSVSQAAGAGAGAIALSPSPTKRAKTDVPSPASIPVTQSTQSQALLAAAGIPITQTQTLQESLKCQYPYCMHKLTSDDNINIHRGHHGAFTQYCEESNTRANDMKKCTSCKLLFNYYHQLDTHMKFHQENNPLTSSASTVATPQAIGAGARAIDTPPSPTKRAKIDATVSPSFPIVLYPTNTMGNGAGATG